MSLENPSQSAAYSVPPSPHGKSFRTPLIAALTILILLAVLVSTYFFLPAVRLFVDTARVVTQMPADLKSAVFINSDSSTGYRVANLALIQETPVKLSLSGGISPSGQQAVYMQSSATGTQQYLSASVTVVTEKWNVLLKEKGGGSQVLAKGYAPDFLDDTHIVFFGTNGITVLSLPDKLEQVLTPYASSTLGSFVQYSPDHSLVLWTDITRKKLHLARLTSTSYVPIQDFAMLPNVALTNTSLYQIRRSASGSEVWKYPFDGTAAERILVFPDTYPITSLWL